MVVRLFLYHIVQEEVGSPRGMGNEHENRVDSPGTTHSSSAEEGEHLIPSLADVLNEIEVLTSYLPTPIITERGKGDVEVTEEECDNYLAIRKVEDIRMFCGGRN